MAIVVFQQRNGRWAIQDTTAGFVLEDHRTQKEAIARARNKWASPRDRIAVKSTSGRIRTLREGR